MKTCAHEGCKEIIDDKFMYCYAHFQAGRYKSKPAAELPPGTWHEDPMVDALLKINNNLSQIVRILKGEGSAKQLKKHDRTHNEDVSYTEETVD